MEPRPEGRWIEGFSALRREYVRWVLPEGACVDDRDGKLFLRVDTKVLPELHARASSAGGRAVARLAVTTVTIVTRESGASAERAPCQATRSSAAAAAAAVRPVAMAVAMAAAAVAAVAP